MAERLDDLPNGKIRIASIYAAGAVMGWTPGQVDACSMWQFMAAWDGYIRANSASVDQLSSREKDELFDWIGADDAEPVRGDFYRYDWDGRSLIASVVR